MKKNLFRAALTVALTVAMSSQAFAAEAWIIDRNTCANFSEWAEKETDAQAEKWAAEHKGDIAAIEDEVERYKAVAKEVCDFLAYDVDYANPHLYYTIRDGKGVCADYTVLTMFLCKQVGLETKHVIGVMDGQGHDWVKVTLNGVEYYSDVTNVDAGFTQQLLSTAQLPGHREEYVSDGVSRSYSTGYGVGEEVEKLLMAPTGMVTVENPDGSVFFISEEDALLLSTGALTIEQILAKYGMN